MKRTLAPLGVVIVATLATGSSCQVKDPCFNLPAPPADVIAVDSRYPNIEMDYVISDKIECDMVNGRWQRETD